MGVWGGVRTEDGRGCWIGWRGGGDLEGDGGWRGWGGREVGGEQRKMSEVSFTASHSALQCPYIIHIVLSLGALADVC